MLLLKGSYTAVAVRIAVATGREGGLLLLLLLGTENAKLSEIHFNILVWLDVLLFFLTLFRYRDIILGQGKADSLLFLLFQLEFLTLSQLGFLTLLSKVAASDSSLLLLLLLLGSESGTTIATIATSASDSSLLLLLLLLGNGSGTGPAASYSSDGTLLLLLLLLGNG